MSDREAYKVEVARTVEDVEKMRGIWEKMQWHPNADIDFYKTILESRPEIIRPHVMLFTENDGSKTMVIGRIEEKRLELKLGYVTVYRPKVRILTIVHGGFMGNMSSQSVIKIFYELLNSLKREKADVLLLSNLRVDSHLYPVARSGPALLCRDNVCDRNMHWQMTMPATVEDFYGNMSSHRKHELRRYGKVLEKSYSEKVSFVAFSNNDNIDKLCDDAEKIAGQTYHRGLGVGFIGNEENRRRIALSAKNGWLRAYVLYVLDKPCAFWIGTLYGNTLYLNFTGYDPQYRKYEVGSISFTRMIEELCREDVKKIDFGSGDAFYKQRFCDTGWEESSLYIFAHTLKGVRINVIRTAITVVAQSLKQLLEKLDFAQKIKRIWRNNVTPARQSGKVS